MPTIVVHHDIDDTERWLASPKREELFGPLGIARTQWATDGQGHSLGNTGLRLSSRDLVRLGELYLHGGRRNGRQIVPASYIHVATRKVTAVGQGVGYGYGWWTLAGAVRGQRVGLPHPVLYAADGRGFHDIVRGNTGGPYAAHRGWDTASGWGSPNGRLLARELGVRGPRVRMPERAPRRVDPGIALELF